MVRRIAAIGVGALILVLLVFVVKGCRDRAKEQSFKDYARDVGALVQESDQESRSLFNLLSRPGDQSPIELQSAINGFRTEAAQLVDRARGTDHPDELDGAQRYLVETLEFRRDGMGAVARDLPAALGDRDREAATGRIAGAMRHFLTSDVIYSQRVVPEMEREYRDEGLLREVNIPRSQFLGDLEWLRASTVGDRIGRIRGGGGAGGRPAPGLHGTSLDSVTVKPGGASLTEGAAAEIRSNPNISFDVTVTNGGETEERDVTVQLAIEGAGRPIRVEERIETIGPGEQKTASIPLAATPPTGRPVTITVNVRPVPGEKKVDNNRREFPAVFTSG